MSIASSMLNQLRPNFWQPQFMNFNQVQSQYSNFNNHNRHGNSLSNFFPSVAGNSVNPATTANSRNLATTI
jgi:hypothetical protein